MVSLSAKTVVLCRFDPFGAKTAPVILCQNSPLVGQNSPGKVILAPVGAKTAPWGQNGPSKFTVHTTPYTIPFCFGFCKNKVLFASRLTFKWAEFRLGKGKLIFGTENISFYKINKFLHERCFFMALAHLWKQINAWVNSIRQYFPWRNFYVVGCLLYYE